MRRKAIVLTLLVAVLGAAVTGGWLLFSGDDPPREPEPVGAPQQAAAPAVQDRAPDPEPTPPESPEPALPEVPAEPAPAGGDVVRLKLPETSPERGMLEVRVFGRVTSEHGSPVAGAKILVDGWALADTGRVPDGILVSPARAGFDTTEVATTGQDGHFDVTVQLPLGFAKAAMAELEVHARGTFADSAPATIWWWNGADSEPVKLVLPPRGGVTGRVVDPSGGGASVFVRVHETRTGARKIVASVISGRDGGFEFRNLAPGKWMISIASDAWLGPPEGVEFEVFTELLVPLAAAVGVTPRRRIEVKLNADGSSLTKHVVDASFMDAEGRVLTHRQFKPFNNGLLRMLDPPANAASVRLRIAGFRVITLQLPDMSSPALYDLGAAHLQPETG